VRTVYLDTSAAAKLVAEEPETAAMAAFVESLDPSDLLLSSALTETELRRMATRREIDQIHVTDVVSRVVLVQVTRSLLRSAGLLPGRDLRSLDAIHVSTAMAAEASELVSYDRRLLDVATGLGLITVTP
jgi:predicted nucleic acid-binding protein